MCFLFSSHFPLLFVMSCITSHNNKIKCLFLNTIQIAFYSYLKSDWDIPGGPVVKTPRVLSRGHRFNPWTEK